jgi:hypothetical protein
LELLYFSDISQLDYVLASKPDFLRKMRPITGDMVVAFELERLGNEFIDEWDFIKADEIEKNRNDAYQISRTWWSEYFASTEYEGLSLADVAKQDLFYPFEASLNARTIYDRIFCTYPVERVSGYFLPSVGLVRTGPAPTSRAVRSITEAIFFYIAERYGIPVDKLISSLPLSQGSITNYGTQLKSIKTAKSPKTGKIADKIILVYKTLMPGSEHTALMKAIDELPGVRAISISEHVLGLSTQPNIESGSQTFWNSFVEFVKTYKGDYPEIFANKNLFFQFERINKEMESALAYGDVFNIFLELLKPSLIIFGYEGFTIERTLVRLAQNKKIPTSSLIHGGVRFKFGSLGFIGDVDAVLAWSTSDIEWLTSYDVDHFRCKKIGCLRYESNYVKYASTHGVDSSKTKIAAKKRLRICPDKPLIVWVTAEINTGLAEPIAEPSKHRGAIREYLSLVESRPDLQFAIKAHPSFDYYELYRNLDSKIPNLKFLEQATLSEILEASDICLMINYCTTASLEAMLHQVPVVYLNNAVYPLLDWRDNLSETGIVRVGSVVELKKTIDNLLNNSIVRQHALTEADKQIKEILGVEEISANQRLIDFIMHVLDGDQVGNAHGLSSIPTMCDIFDSNDEGQLSISLTELVEAHSHKSVLYVLTYLAGSENSGLPNIARIFERLHNIISHEILESWNIARWELMPFYISGRLENWGSGRVGIFDIKLLIPYILHPRMVAATPTSTRKNLFVYILRVVFGQKYFAFKQLIIRVRRMYFVRI